MSLDSIRARVEAATSEPWLAEEIAGAHHVMVGYPFGDTIGVFNEEDDAELAAHARADIPLLLKVAEAAEGVCIICKLQGHGTSFRDCWYVSDGDGRCRCRVGAALAELEAGE